MLKATVLIENMLEGITFVHHAVSPRNPLPILLNFHIEAKEGSLIISATDLEIGIQKIIPAKVDKEGAVTVPAKTFLDLVSSINQDRVGLLEDENVLVLSAPGLKTTFPTIPAKEFPKLFEEKGQKRATVKKDNFVKEVTQIVYAAASDATRPALSGVLMDVGDKETALVATDGYRLSLKKDADVKITEKNTTKSLIIPARIIKEVVGAKKTEADLVIYITDSGNQVLFDLGEGLVVGRLIEAEYPDYQKIIPSSFETRTEFDKADALGAVRGCSVFAREAANIIKMDIKKDKIVFSASAASAGENKIEIDAKTKGEENEIAFNSRYLMDFLSNANDENILFEMTGPLNPGVFKTPNDPSFLHLIMPIRVAG